MYWTSFKKFGPLSEKSLPLLVTQPGYGPDSYFDNLEFDIFHAGDPQCQFITSVNIAVRIQTLSAY